MSVLVAAAMVLSALPVFSAEGPEGPVLPRSVTDDSNDLIIPEGEVYELSGCHTYKKSVQINGILNVKPWDGRDDTTGVLWLKAPNITVGASGSIHAEGRGYGGGGGGLNYYSNGVGGYGGTDGKGGNGGNAQSYYMAGGGGGGSNGGRGGSGYSGSNGQEGTDLKGGNGGTGGYSGGAGGAGFGSGGGGGGAYYGGGAGGGGGGTGGKDAQWYNGGDGGGPYGGKGPNGVSWTNPGPNEYGRNGGYAENKTNGDSSVDLSVLRGSGGSGGATVDYYYGGGGGGGGAGGGAITLIADQDVKISGTVLSTGGSGGQGGMNVYGGPGGRGGGGAGGGIALSGLKLVISGTVDAMGRDGQTPSATNGGSIKLLYGDVFQNNGVVQGGRVFTNGRPKMKGLDSPLANAQVVRKPTFKWNEAVDPEKDPITYEIELATSAAFSPVSRRKTDIATTSFSFDNPLSGTMYWRVRGVDRCGPGGWSEVRKFIVDDKAPTSNIVGMGDYTTSQEFKVSWTGQDNEGGSGIANWTIMVSDNGAEKYKWLEGYVGDSATFVGTEGHSYTFNSLATDFADNTESLRSDAAVTTTIDSVAPVASITAMPPFQSRANFMVAWTARDTTSGVADYTVFVSIDGGDFTVWQDNTTESTAQYIGVEGHRYTFAVIARDVAGNVQTFPGIERYGTTSVDGTAPKTAFSPAAPYYGENPTYIRPTANIYLNGTDNFAGINNTRYIVDKLPQQDYLKPFRVVQSGSHNLTYWSVDAAGNEEAKRVTWFWVDGDAPATSLAYVGPNWTTETKIFISSQTYIAFTATDGGSGVNRTEYNIDGSGWVTYTGPFRLPKSGLHSLKFHSVDNLLQEDNVKNASVVMDVWPPNSQALAEKTRSGQDIVVELRGTDLESGLAGIYYRIIKPGEPGMNFVNGTLATVRAASDHSLDGNYTIEYYALDNVGNKEETRKIVVTVDTVGTLKVDIKGSPTVNEQVYHVSGLVEPGSEVTVNGFKVLVRPDGSFDYEMELKDGANKILVSSTDKAGNTATTTKTVTYTKKQETGWLLPVVAAVVVAGAVAGVLGFMTMRKKPKSAAPAPAPVPGPQAPPPIPPPK